MLCCPRKDEEMVEKGLDCEIVARWSGSSSTRVAYCDTWLEKVDGEIKPKGRSAEGILKVAGGSDEPGKTAGVCSGYSVSSS